MKEHPNEKSRSHWVRTSLSTAAIIVILAVLLLWADPRDVYHTLADFNPMIILSVLVLYIINLLTKTLRWKWLLEAVSKKDVPLPWALKNYTLCMGINNISPGRVWGEPVRIVKANRDLDIPLGSGFATVVSEKLLDVIIILSIVVVGILLIFFGGYRFSSSLNILLAGMLIICVSLLAFIFVLFKKSNAGSLDTFSKKIVTFIGRFFRTRREQVEKKLGIFTKQSVGAVERIKKADHTLANTTVLTVIIWLNEAGRLYLILIGLGAVVGPGAVLFGSNIAALSGLFIPAGVGNAATVGMFYELWGLSGPLSVSAGLILAVTSVWVSALLAMLIIAFSMIVKTPFDGKARAAKPRPSKLTRLGMMVPKGTGKRMAILLLVAVCANLFVFFTAGAYNDRDQIREVESDSFMVSGSRVTGPFDDGEEGSVYTYHFHWLTSQNRGSTLTHPRPQVEDDTVRINATAVRDRGRIIDIDLVCAEDGQPPRKIDMDQTFLPTYNETFWTAELALPPDGNVTYSFLVTYTSRYTDVYRYYDRCDTVIEGNMLYRDTGYRTETPPLVTYAMMPGYGLARLSDPTVGFSTFFMAMAVLNALLIYGLFRKWGDNRAFLMALSIALFPSMLNGALSAQDEPLIAFFFILPIYFMLAKREKLSAFMMGLGIGVKMWTGLLLPGLLSSPRAGDRNGSTFHRYAKLFAIFLLPILAVFGTFFILGGPEFMFFLKSYTGLTAYTSSKTTLWKEIFEDQAYFSTLKLILISIVAASAIVLILVSKKRTVHPIRLTMVMLCMFFLFYPKILLSYYLFLALAFLPAMVEDDRCLFEVFAISTIAAIKNIITDPVVWVPLMTASWLMTLDLLRRALSREYSFDQDLGDACRDTRFGPLIGSGPDVEDTLPVDRIVEPSLDHTVVVPIYNERDNIESLLDRLEPVMMGLGGTYEIILVDDGSTDGSREAILKRKRFNRTIRYVGFTRNHGQTAAMQAGFDLARGRTVITLDGDLQNDPEDIPGLLRKLDEGYDMVSGWRYDRKDPKISKNMVSRMANGIERQVTGGLDVHDYGCSLKVYRHRLAKSFRLTSDHHRFLPAIAHWEGYRIGEVKVRHHRRRAGTTKYGISRIYRGFVDMLALARWYDRSNHPWRYRGGIVLASIFSTLPFTINLLLNKIPELAIRPQVLIIEIAGGAIAFLTIFLWIKVRIVLGRIRKRHDEMTPIYSIREIV